MTKINKTDVSLLNKKLKKYDQYLKAKKYNGTIFIVHSFASSRDTILQINIDESGELTFQTNGFNIFPLSAITILQNALKAVAEWNEVESNRAV